MSMSLAVIIQNYRRPQNIGRIVRAAREALPDADIFLLDQADEDLRGRDDIPWGEVWFQRAEVNRGAGARVPITARRASTTISPSTTTPSSRRRRSVRWRRS